MFLATLPDHDFLPAPLWLIAFLHLLTLTLHMVAMNFLLGGLVVVIFGRFTDRWEHPVVHKLVKLFPTLMAATVTLGVAPLLFAQLTYGRSIYSASIISGWLWILIPVIVIVTYYLIYGSALSEKGRGKNGVRAVLALVGLLYVSFVFTSVFSLMERPDLQNTLYAENQSGLVLNPNVLDWIFRWLHMVAGAVTIGAWLVGVLGRNDDEAAAAGRLFFIVGIVLASVTGVAHLMSRGDVLLPFMRSSAIGTMTVGALLSLVAVPFFLKGRFGWSGVLLFISVGSMVMTRHTTRLLTMPEELDPQNLYAGKEVPQWDVFLIFAVCFLIALALVAWMLKLFFGRQSPQAT